MDGLIKALKPGGVWFMSFKKASVAQASLQVLRLWTTQDVRKGREREQRTNAESCRLATGDLATERILVGDFTEDA
jgi:hypothetical protein